MDTLLPYLLALKNEALANTDWFDSSKKYVAVLLPNFFILYFSQKPPTGDIISDNVKMAFATLGKGYETWCTVAEEAITSSRKIATVLTTAAEEANYNHVGFVQKYFDKNWTGKKMQLTADGPILPIMLVSSNVYPVEAAKIKKDFLAQPLSSAVHPSFNTLTIQHPGELGQEAEAKKA